MLFVHNTGIMVPCTKAKMLSVVDLDSDPCDPYVFGPSGSESVIILCNAEIILFNRFLMHFEQAVRRNGKKGFNCICQSRNSPGFNPNALRHDEIRGAADEAVMKKFL